MVPADQWTLVRGLSHAAFLALLMQLAQAVDLAKYRKHAAEDLGAASAGRIAGDRLPRNSGEETARVWTSV